MPCAACGTLRCLVRPPKSGTLANSEDQEKLRHFIRVCTVCSDEIDLQRNKYNVCLFFLKLKHVAPQYIQWTVSNFTENSIGLKRVKLLWFITIAMLEFDTAHAIYHLRSIIISLFAFDSMQVTFKRAYLLKCTLKCIHHKMVNKEKEFHLNQTQNHIFYLNCNIRNFRKRAC